MFNHLRRMEVPTTHGVVVAWVAPDLVYINRHHTAPDGEYALPHAVNYRGVALALKQLDARLVVAVCSVGALSTALTPGTLALLDDYNGLFAPPVHLHDDARAHVVPELSPDARARVRRTLVDFPLAERDVVYVQTCGPRLETKAEIRFIAGLGDVVGMTGASEATCCCELAIPYVSLCMVDNLANGIGPTRLTMDEFNRSVAANLPVVERAVRTVLAAEDVALPQ